jgi:protein involved in polysaccharide export with SLBB domain
MRKYFITLKNTMLTPFFLFMSCGRGMLLIFFILLFSGTGIAQTTASPEIQAQARMEIQRRGLEESEVRARLLQRGIDVDKISPEQLPSLQATLTQVLNELENEKKAAKNEVEPQAQPQEETKDKSSQIARDRAEQIQQKVKQGISVEEAISEELREGVADSLPAARIWGQHLFRDRSLSVFRTTNEVKPPDTYVLSAGDEITISVFGASQFDSKYEIKKDGYIQPSGMPKIFLKGLRLAQARELLRNRFAQFYRFAPEQFAVTLSTARSITVNIFGESVHYGSFSLSAINTAFNALMAAGGPTDLGSVRSIKVIRGKDSKMLDVYAFMNNPGIQYDYFLEDNDIIHIPVSERVVTVNGSVRRPFRYELTGTEQLLKALEYAGGFSADAYREIIQIQRFIKDRQVLIDVNLSELATQKQDFPLQDGDVVLVRNITAKAENLATISGAVLFPGQYAIGETRHISDLIRKSALRRDARTDIGFLLRTNADNTKRLIQLDLAAILRNPGAANDPELAAQDQVTIFATSQFTDASTISVVGAVRDSLIAYAFPQDSSIDLRRAILLAGGLRPDASGKGLILRTNLANFKEKQYIEVDLAAAFDRPQSPANQKLKPFDRIEVLSRPDFEDEATISINGAVRKPGKFAYGKGMSLRDALLLAGGLKLEAAKNRVDIFRIQIQENEPTRTIVATLSIDADFNIMGSSPNLYAIYPYDEIEVRSVPEFEFQRYVMVEGEVRYPGRYALISDNETIADVIQRAGGLSPEAFSEGATLFRESGRKGYIVTNFVDALQNRRSPHNHILQSEDRISIPKREDLVSIVTANTNAEDALKSSLLRAGQINVAHHSGKKAAWYIKEYAAGFAKNAKRSRVTVEHANGKISGTRKFGLFRIYPKVSKGATIKVAAKPEKIKKDKNGNKKSIDWDKALTQILAVAGTMATIILATAALK